MNYQLKPWYQFRKRPTEKVGLEPWPKRFPEKWAAYRSQITKELGDSYIKRLIFARARAGDGLRESIPQEMIDAYRVVIQYKRLCKNQKT